MLDKFLKNPQFLPEVFETMRDGLMVVDNEGYISVTLTREEIANAIGTATESTIRLLSEFKKEGYISLTGKKIRIENKVKLQHLTEGY